MTTPPVKRWPSNPFHLLLRPLAAGLLCGWFSLSMAGTEELDPQSIKQLRDSGLIVALYTILHDVQQRYQFSHLVEAELQRSDAELIYEIEFLDGDGELRELYYDARSGQLLFYEIYSTDTDGRLRSIKYDAADDTPVSYEFEVPE